MNDKEANIEYEEIPHRQTSENRLVMICEKTEPEDILTVDNSQDVTYEIHDGEDIYHLVEQTTAPIKRPPPPTLITNNHSSDANNCQYFVINESLAKRPCLILPKPDNFPIINDTQQKVQPKKRDDKRRATHNEVERRRRDKINQWIFKLKELLPEDSVVAEKKLPAVIGTGKTSQNDSKSAILIKACDYVRDMQEELNSLKKCLSNSENLHRENSILRAENELLKSEIEQLKNISVQKQIPRTAADSTNFETT